MSQDIRHFLDQCALVAIIRGVTPGEVEAIGAAIFDAGIRIIEVPLNSPEPFDSIGHWYQDFTETGDDRVRELLARALHAA